MVLIENVPVARPRLAVRPRDRAWAALLWPLQRKRRFMALMWLTGMFAIGSTSLAHADDLFTGPYTGAEIADHLQDWVADMDVDGFNLAYAITPGTFEDVVTHVIPELQKRGAYPTEYAEGTLRNKLLGRGDRLPEEHRGARDRVGAPAAG